MIKRCVILCTTLILTSCQDPLTTGTVLSKRFIPAHNEPYSCQIGSTRVGDIDIPIYGACDIYIPSQWVATIEGNTDKGESRVEAVVIDSELYDTLERGDEIYKHGRRWEFEP